MSADQHTPTYILDDLPAETDALDFAPYINTLAGLIQSPNTSTPLTIGVFGTWGAGKTSLMRQVMKALPGSYRSAWFDAWKYEKEADLWRAMLLQVLNALQEALPKNAKNQVDKEALQQLEDLRNSLYRAVEREELGGLEVDWGKLATGVAEGSLKIGLSLLPVVGTLTKMAEELEKGGATATGKIIEAIHRERSLLHIDQVQFLEQFQDKFRELVDRYVVQKKHRLVVFVDDLDRCLPEKAVEVLEATKLFLDVPGCVFVLGLDDKVIARGVEIKYRQLGLVDGDGGTDAKRLIVDGTRYLEKIIQLPFQLPPIERAQLETFVCGLVADWPHPECPHVFAEGLGGNPRQVKRTINLFLLLSGLAQARKEELGERIHPVRLAKIVTIQSAYQTLYDFLKEDRHRYLRDLEKSFLTEARPGEGRLAEGEIEKEESRPELPAALEPYLRAQGVAAVRRVLALHPDKPEFNFGALQPDDLRVYFTLARRAEAPQVMPVPQSQPRSAIEPELVHVPAGEFLMGSTEAQVKDVIAQGLQEEYAKRELPQHSLVLPEYWMAKYPVTNAEYQAFVQAVNHAPPRGWDGPNYPEGIGDHPVVNVTWHDAVAYCEWLSQATGKPYRLPSEAEWEKAARGTDGWIYPWGNNWDAQKCNTSDGGVGGTTPVGQYSPQGDSPYGCADMAGNVWEWTLSLLDKYPCPDDAKQRAAREDLNSTNNRVLRGGSFSGNARFARGACRYRDLPDFRNYDVVGFRVIAASLF